MLTVSEIKKLLKQGYNDEQIGEIIGCSKYKICRFRKANNIPNSKYYKKQQQIRDIKKYSNRCNTQEDLAKKLNISSSRTSEILISNNIEFQRKTPKIRFRKFGTWTIKKRLEDDAYECLCDCGNVKIFTREQILRHSNRCNKCNMTLSIREREKRFTADFKRSERVRKKELQKRGKSCIIDDVSKVYDIGINTYVNLLCTKGHMTKNKFSSYDGCKICKQV